MNDIIFIDGVSYTKTGTLYNNDDKIKVDTLNEMKCIINMKIDQWKCLIDNFKSEGLTFNSVEAEGGLRALLTVVNELDWMYPENYDKEEV